MRSWRIVGLIVVAAACGAGALELDRTSAFDPGRFLFIWAGDADKRDSDFLTVLDVDPRSARYASLVATLPVGVAATLPHHTEYEMPASGVLWANGFNAGRTFLFDLRDARRPSLRTSFTGPEPLGHPHSYARLPNGNVLATLQ